MSDHVWISRLRKSDLVSKGDRLWYIEVSSPQEDALRICGLIALRYYVFVQIHFGRLYLYLDPNHPTPIKETKKLVRESIINAIKKIVSIPVVLEEDEENA